MHWYKLTDIRRSVTLTRNTALVLFYYCYCITLLCEQVKVTRCFIIYAIAKFKNYKATSDKGTLKLFYKLETKFWKIKYQILSPLRIFNHIKYISDQSLKNFTLGWKHDRFQSSQRLIWLWPKILHSDFSVINGSSCG